MATAYDCKFIETSVGINHNVDELLVGLLSQIRLKLENPEKSRLVFAKAHKTFDCRFIMLFFSVMQLLGICFASVPFASQSVVPAHRSALVASMPTRHWVRLDHWVMRLVRRQAAHTAG